MDTSKTIPIVVGVTGHRAIREQDCPAIREAVRTELEKLRTLCPNSPLVMLSSLAEGADLLCADAAEELKISLIAVLPREREDYEKDFSEEGRARFAHHCACAEQVFVAPQTEAPPENGEDRTFQFRQAGIYVATHCHVLLALWDGEPGRRGCGTAEAVDFVLNGSYDPKSGAVVRSGSNEAVIHIFTPRGEQAAAAGEIRVLGNAEAVSDILRKTDDFNRKVALSRMEPGVHPLPTEEKDAVLERMETVSRTAGKLSRASARQYRRVLALLAAVSAMLAFAFLMYDEVQLIWMILVCGVMLIAAWGCRRYAVCSDCHRRYLEFRVLAECLRVQTFLRYAGSKVQAADLLSWTQQEETAWILDALCALNIGAPPKCTHEIKDCWVEEQLQYHRKAAKSTRQKLATDERTVHTALFLSIGLYLTAVVFELMFGGLVFRPVEPLSNVEFWRTALKLVLGTISVVTLFTANYYGRQSLSRRLSDSRKMERFFRKMSVRLEERGQTEELLTLLAREELIENGNWCSYQRDNTPEISF